MGGSVRGVFPEYPLEADLSLRPGLPEDLPLYEGDTLPKNLSSTERPALPETDRGGPT
jgi:hypothetical protein